MNTIYAGFWLRFVAWFIDVCLLGMVGWIIIAPMLATVGLASNFSFSDFQNTEDVAALIGDGPAGAKAGFWKSAGTESL